jgi:hypothetical protein
MNVKYRQIEHKPLRKIGGPPYANPYGTPTLFRTTVHFCPFHVELNK